MSRSGLQGLFLFGMFVAVAAAQDAGSGLEPGVKRVCVPAADGRTWNCGTTDDPPQAHPLAPPPDAPPPPPFLMDPSRAAGITPSEAAPVAEAPAAAARPLPDEFPSAPEREATDPAAAAQSTAGAAVASSEAGAAETESAAEPVAEPAPVAEAGPTPEPAPVADTEPAAQEIEASAPPPYLLAPDGGSSASPEPLASEPSEAPGEPVPAENTAATEGQPAVMETPAAEAPVPEPPLAPSDSSYAGAPPRSAEEFLQLAPGGHTAQLAHAASPDGFRALIAALGIAADTTYALPLPRDGSPWWVLVWSSFPDPASARAAVLALPNVPGLNVGWPRRIALIQSELRANAR